MYLKWGGGLYGPAEVKFDLVKMFLSRLHEPAEVKPDLAFLANFFKIIIALLLSILLKSA